MFMRRYGAAALVAVGIAFAVSAPPAQAKTTLQIVKGSGDFQSLETAITVTEQQVTTYQWSTDAAGATGATWKVVKTSAPNVVVATGKLNTVPAAGKIDRFDIAKTAFLAATAPASAVTYSITIVPHNAANVDLGAPSTAVTVAQAPAGPGVVFGPNAVFPDVELVSYKEQIGVVPGTQLHYARATLTLRLVNRSGQTTEPFWLSSKDSNGLMRQPTRVSVDKMAKNAAAVTKTLQLEAILPPPTSQTPEEAQYSKWLNDYRERCGVDLVAVIDWRGPQAETPIGNHVEHDIYLGSGDSTPTQAGTPEAPLCDTKTCVSLGAVARRIHKQLDCKAVGYAFFLGRGSSVRAEGVGYARTSADSPEVKFTPTMRMQLASVSKVITALAAVRVLQKKNIGLNAEIGSHFPSGWTVDKDTTAKITFRELLSQTSGIQNYGNFSMSDANLKTFFTQTVTTPGAARTCPGPGTKMNPDTLTSVTDPIITDKTPCYSNFNFAIFRVLLPRIDGYTGDDADTRAARFVKLVQDNVFTPIGITDADCKPPAVGFHAISYNRPGTTPGFDWGDFRLGCGGAGFTLSATDLGKMMTSLNAADGKIFSKAQFFDAETNPAAHALGFDTVASGGYRWLEKNGGMGGGNAKGSGTLTTSIAIFGGAADATKPVPGFVGVLLINSDVPAPDSTPATPKTMGADTVLLNAFKAAAKPKP